MTLQIPAPPTKAVARQIARRKFNAANPYRTLTHIVGSVLAEPTPDLDKPVLADIDRYRAKCAEIDRIKSGQQTGPGACPTHLGSNFGAVSSLVGAKSLAQAAKLADRGKNDIWVGRTSTDPKLKPKIKDIKDIESLKDLLPVE
jgi:hypothetical protein